MVLNEQRKRHRKQELASRLPPGGNKVEEVFSEQLATLQSEISKASALIEYYKNKYHFD